MDGRLVMGAQTDIAADVTLAEAAAWLARLQGEGRTPATEAAFKDWVAEPDHARAFARATETWEVIAGAALAGRRATPARPRRAPALAAAALVLIVVGVGAGASVLRDPAYRTAVGQQQTLTLSDGTRVALNTDSRIVVDYRAGERRVRLERGEAMFEVAKNPRRPFIVQAGDEQVRALGTTFVVRRDAGRMSVVLIEGRVEVSPRPGRAEPSGRPAGTTVLSPGERLIIKAGAAIAVDRPKVETATAWRRGEVMFDDASLGEAVAELNRYGGTPVAVSDPRLDGLRVSGVFKTQDPGEFAETVAQLHGLRVTHGEAEILLRR
jgi:transmembrane sensor